LYNPADAISGHKTTNLYLCWVADELQCMITAQHCSKIRERHYGIQFLWWVICSWPWRNYGWKTYTTVWPYRTKL